MANTFFRSLLVATVSWLIPMLIGSAILFDVTDSEYQQDAHPLFYFPNKQEDSNSDASRHSGRSGSTAGPFIGYFPNFLGKPCPNCSDTAVCRENCVPPPVKLTVCDTSGSLYTPLAMSPVGTISVADDSTLTTNTACMWGIVIDPMYKGLQVTCTKLTGSTANFAYNDLSPSASGTGKDLEEGVPFTAVDNQGYITITLYPNSLAECSWKGL